jgi:hypothetical protein
MRVSGILIHQVNISNKIYCFYKAIQKQICNVHMLADHLPSCRCHYSRVSLNLWMYYSICIWNFSSISLLCQRRRYPCKNEVKLCSFEFALGFCKMFFACNRQIHVTDEPHSPYMLDNREFTAQGKDVGLSILPHTVTVALTAVNSHCSWVDCIPINQSSLGGRPPKYVMNWRLGGPRANLNMEVKKRSRLPRFNPHPFSS